MKTVTQSYRTGELKVVDAPPPQLKGGYVMVRNAYSLISAGTEKTKVDTADMSLAGKARSRPDLVRQVIDKALLDGVWKTMQTVNERLSTPLPMGYSSAGVITEVMGEVGGLQVGDRVACAGSHAEYVCVPRNLVVKIPDNVQIDHSAFATVGAIAMQGVRQADARIGERVVVIGLGLIGLLTVQILRAAGCRVFGVDLDPNKVDEARRLGCDEAGLANDDRIKDQIKRFANGHGADSTIITAGTQSNGPIEQAGEVTREKGRIVVLGAARMDIPREPFYSKELEIRLSRSYGPGRYDRTFEEGGRDYPYAYVRFTETRNMSSFLDLLSAGTVDVGPMITHRFPVTEAARAYDVIRGERTERYLGILLEYDQVAETLRRRVEIRSTAPARKDQIRLGVIGAGKYATANLLPYIPKEAGIALGAICTASGLTAVHVAEKFGFEAAASNVDEVIAASDAVLIATRHDDHAPLAAKALELGKAVFVEKPLAISKEQLDAVVRAAARPGSSITVGFNRRFAPTVDLVKKHLQASSGPRQVLIRVNAGMIALDHWIQDPTVGGGRLIGEACHFVDLAVHLCDSLVSSVHAAAIPQPGRAHALWDNFSIHLSFANGSVATIVYTSLGDSRLPKEYVEVFGGGRVGVIHDFRAAELWKGGKRRRVRQWKQDKGQREEMRAWTKSLRVGLAPIPFEELVNVHQACFAAIDALQTGQVVSIDVEEAVSVAFSHGRA